MDVHVPTETGHWVSEKFQMLNEIIHDFDPKLDLRFLPAEYRTGPNQKVYVIVDTTCDQVCYGFRENVTPEEVLEKLFMGDNRDGKVLDRIDARNAAAKVIAAKEEMDKWEELADYARFLMASKKNYIHHKRKDGTRVKLDDQLREIQ